MGVLLFFVFIVLVISIVKKIMKPWMEDAGYMYSLQGNHEKQKDLGTKISEHSAISNMKNQ